MASPIESETPPALPSVSASPLANNRAAGTV